MSVDNELDLNTLSWVKSEIDETLSQARSALEVYAEDQADETQLQFCKNYLHQIRGTLQMVELYGASLAAEEMEVLCDALLEEKVNNRNDAFEVLMRGILQLPDYLEHLLAGHQDTPMILMPLLNDLRAARGEALLSENALFTPNLAVKAPLNDAITGEDLAELARKLRHHYHLGLLGWFRDKDCEASLGRIADVIEQLRESATEAEVNRLLWVAGGLVESLRQGGLDSSVSVKLLLGQLDRQIKKIIDNGVTALSHEPPSELLKNLLYYVATSGSDGERTRELKQAFNLHEALPDTQTLEQARADLAGPNAQLMNTVSSVLMDDLLKVKDTLDVFVRADNRDVSELGPLCDTMKQMADTLAMLGLGIQRNVVNDQITVLSAMLNGEQEVDDTALMDVAGAMLSLESSLSEASTARAANEDVEEFGAESDDAAKRLQDAEQQKLQETVIEQAKIELARVKEAISDFSKNPGSIETLHVVPPILDQIKGSITILNLERAAKLLGQSNEYIKRDLIERAITPDTDALENLADAISSIEYYLESLVGKWGNPETILTIAEKSLAEIIELAKDAEEGSAQLLADANQPDLAIPEIIDAAAVDEDTLVDLPQIEESELSPDELSPDELSPDELSTGELSLDEISLQQSVADEDTLTDLSVADLEQLPEESVADLSDLSLTESDESDTSLVELSESEEASAEITLDADSFIEDDSPTLSIEGFDEAAFNLDETETADASEAGLTLEGLDESLEIEGLELSDDAADDAGLIVEQEILPDSPELLVEESAESELTGQDDALEFSLDLPEEQTQTLAEEQIADKPAEQIPTQAEISSVAMEKPAAPMDEIDDEIIEIFMEEAEEEYGNISRLLPQWISNQQDEEALKDMRRSFHTLKGSGRLVGATDVGEFAWAYENMLNRLIDHTITTSPGMFEVLQQGMQTLPELFDLFRSGSGKPSQKILALMEHAEAISQGKEVSLEAVPSQEQQAHEVAVDEVAAEADTEIDDVTEELTLEVDSVEQPPLAEAESLEIESATVEETDAVEQSSSESAEVVLDVPLPDIDPVLLDIYRKEVDTHLNTLRNYVDGWYNNIDRSANNDLLRAVHTLTGSSRTTGVTSVSELCSLYEKLIKDLQQYNAPLDDGAVDVLRDAIDYISATTLLLDQPGAELPDNKQYIDIITSLNDALHTESPTVEINLSDVASETAEQPPAATQQQAETQDVAHSAPQPLVEYDEELLEIFIEEGEEILNESDETLTRWIDAPDDHELVEEMQRQLHTLKGGARMAGISEIGDLGHSIESMLTAVVDGHMTVSRTMFELLQKSQDRLVSMIEKVKVHEHPQPANDLILEVDSILGRHSLGRAVESIIPEILPDNKQDIVAELEMVEATLGDAPTANEPEQELPEVITLDETPEVEVVEAEAAQEPQAPVATEMQETALAEEDDGSRDRRKAPRVQQEQVRIRADLLDNLVNFAGEVSIYRSRMEQQSNSFRYNLVELDDTVSRLRDQLRQFEIETETQIQFRQEETLAQEHENFDPLEFDRFTHMQHLSRGMMESLSDLDSIRGILSGITRESETLLLQQSRVNTELQEGLMRTRMVPFSGQAPRLRRIVRQTSDELGKKVELRLNGVDNELDRSVLDRIIPPIEHMLRNAISHGIEAPVDRSAAGKKEAGVINLSFGREGSDIVITVSDDGAGINLKAIHKKAIERGLLKPGAKVSKEILLNMIMESGFSTADQVTQISGRGVGMDVVNTEIKQLGGLFEIDTREGKGTTFTVSLPLTLAITRALMVNVGEDTYAIPLLSVHSVERISASELSELRKEETPIYKWLDQDYRLLHLGTIMGTNAPLAADEDDKIPLLLVRSGEHRAAIQVEGLIGSREIVVKPVGPQLSTLRGISGATIMGDGSVVLIMDLPVLIRLAAAQEGEDVIDFTPEIVPEVHTKPVVMVVDDSITVRKVTTRLLERHNYEIMAAKDGVDALAHLQERIPDVMLLDVEMPRMDGFELATNMRNDERLKHIPIIMITSRTGQKHRDRAMDIGVNIYMGKPFNDTTLLENINTLLDS